jgi:hypothetical protein
MAAFSVKKLKFPKLPLLLVLLAKILLYYLEAPKRPTHGKPNDFRHKKIPRQVCGK